MISARQAAAIRRMTSRGSPKFYLVFIAFMLFLAGLAVYPYLPPVRAERERIVALARAELDRLAPPEEALTLGTYSSIDLGRGPGAYRNYGSVASCQEVHAYYADTLARAGWTQWVAPYEKHEGVLVLVTTYRKQTQGVSLKLILDCEMSGGSYDIEIIQPDFCNSQNQPAAP